MREREEEKNEEEEEEEKLRVSIARALMCLGTKAETCQSSTGFSQMKDYPCMIQSWHV